MRRGRHRNAVTARLDRTLAGAALFRFFPRLAPRQEPVGFEGRAVESGDEGLAQLRVECLGVELGEQHWG